MLSESVLLLAVIAIPPQQVPDSVRALHQAQELVLDHYDVSRFGPNHWMQKACRGVSLHDCMNGDWSCEGFVCDSVKVEVRPLLIERLERLAARAGNSEWLYRQRVGFAIKNGELERATAIARSCGAGDWWCMTLRGLTGHLLSPGAGLAQFDSAFALMIETPQRNPSGEFAWGRGPDAECQWSDISAVAPLEMREEILASPCSERRGMVERF